MCFLLMHTTGVVEIINTAGLSLCRRLQMLGAHGVCALESSSFSLYFIRWLHAPTNTVLWSSPKICTSNWTMENNLQSLVKVFTCICYKWKYYLHIAGILNIASKNVRFKLNMIVVIISSWIFNNYYYYGNKYVRALYMYMFEHAT